MTRIFTLGLIFFLLASFSFGQLLSDKADQLTQAFEKADYVLLKTELPLAIEKARNQQEWEQAGKLRNLEIRWQLADGHFEEAERLLHAAQKENNLPNTHAVSIELGQLNGNLLLAKGRNDLATESLKTAYETASAQLGASHSLTASTANDLGLAYWNSQNLEQALAYIQTGLAIRKKTAGELSVAVAASYNNMGLIYASTNTNEAILYFQKALKIQEKELSANHPAKANTLNNLALAYLANQETDAAQQYFNKVLAIRQAVYGENHPNVAFVYNNIGQVLQAQNNTEKALEFFGKALTTYKAQYGEKHPEVAQTYNMIGNAHLQQNDYTMALQSFQLALVSNAPNFSDTDIKSNPDGSSYYNADLLLATYIQKAQALEARHYGKTLRFTDLEMALQTLELADQLIVKIRQQRFTKKDKIALGKMAAEAYEDGIRLCLQMAQVSLSKMNYWQKAFAFSEKSKSTVLLSSITEANAFAGLPDSLLQSEKSLKAAINYTEQRLAQVNEATERESLRASLFEAKREYERLIKKLETNFPEYFQLKFSSNVASIADIQALLPTGTVMISYFLPTKDDRLYAFVLNNRKLTAHNLPVTANFVKKIAGLRNAIRFDVADAYTETAHELYRQLLKGLIPSGTHHLIILPDGPIATVPFEALLLAPAKKDAAEAYTQHRYLVQQYAVTYHFSATLYQYLTTQFLAKNTATGQQGILLCAPIDFQGTEYHPVRSGLPTLPASEDEIVRIKQLFEEQGKTAKVFSRKEAHEGIMKSDEIKQYRYVHLATHGVVNMENPDLSQVFMATNATNEEDGNLYAGEIYGMALNADLVTLSACETGLGKIARGEGIIGLSRALIYAGAHNLMVSLWTVADNSTSELMVDFYQDLLTEKKPVAYYRSLQNAKKQMLAHPAFASPYFWAPFILIGQ